eukprot:gene11454-11600_t
MARKKVREYTGKRLLKAAMQRLFGMDLPISVAQIQRNTDFLALLEAHPWLNQTQLVVKPDMLFGQRGKNDLVGLNLDFAQAEEFIRARMGKQVTIKGCTGPVTTFVVEPFMPHKEEYYLCIQSNRLDIEVSFSTAGGMDIEENWDKVKTITIPTATAITGDVLAPLVSALPLEIRPTIEAFLANCLAVFDDLDATLLEMNPFTFDSNGKPFPLDIRMELDDTAAFRNVPSKWGEDLEFPLPFGRVLTAAEEYVHGLDESTGASLKAGQLFTHAARPYTVGDLGYAQELGNYGEYSGAPNTAETYAYAKTVLECVTANPDGRGRALLIGGGIANFTVVLQLASAHTGGIIRAIRELAPAMKAANVRLFVRRGGPSYQQGLAAMKAMGEELGLPVEVYGPESSMTGICAAAIDYVKSCDK